MKQRQSVAAKLSTQGHGTAAARLRIRPCVAVLVAVLLAVLLAVASLARADAPSLQAPAGDAQALSHLVIETRRGPVVIEVELAQTPQQHARGLQERRTLAANAGMLFDFDPPRVVSMWMKDTYIPLDMLFIAANGVVSAIAADTEPLSLEIIAPPDPVRAVLELNAGTAARLGIRAGDRVRHPIFPGRG